MGGRADVSGSGHGELTSSEEIEFVNREIDRQLELWRHADDAVLGPAGPFIGLSATLIPAAVLLSDVVEETRRFYLACIPVGLFLACLAVLLAARVMGTTMVKHGCMLRVGVLRSYFVDRSPDLGGYLQARLRHADVEAELRDMAAHTRGGVIVHPLVAGSSGLFGAAAGFAVWWMAEDASPWLLVVAGSLATLVALGVELAFMAQRRRTVAWEIAAELGIVPTP